ncbi:MAG: amidase [Cyclobacteriaceae bacterium]|nr:amidase [Cyclobacteriaceae bacterium HetDA_MAG_MS6]
MKNCILFLLLIASACQPRPKTTIQPWEPYDESEELAQNADHESVKLRYKLIQSRVLDKNDLWERVADQISDFSEENYHSLQPLILDQDIPAIQSHIQASRLSYEKLTQWYLYRIVKYENDKDKMLNAIISLNPEAVSQAQLRDANKSEGDHPIYGMPILVKDNINVDGMLTTAGSYSLRNNATTDAFIIKKLKEKGAIILGKTNLSEWANFLCRNCPNGYSAIGGQTLNAYGRKVFDTGGSSSGSGVAMAANYAVAAIGTETSGSILSPSSKSSIVGLKPTVGLLSRGGIVPISSTLDTPGPMTRSVTDNAILLSAMTGIDDEDPSTQANPQNKNYLDQLKEKGLEGLRFGVNKNFLEDSLYLRAIKSVVELGGVAIEFEPEKPNFEGFGDMLSADMKVDLEHYLDNYASSEIDFSSVADIVKFNQEDTLIRIPYGQARFAGMLDVEVNEEELSQLKNRLHQQGIRFFEIPMKRHQLDAVLSINNWNAGYAATAKYPCLTVPMGYTEKGEPKGLTFIGRPYEEDMLLQMSYAFEQATLIRKSPSDYK